MNKIERIGQTSLFTRDYAAWALQQAADLRAGAWEKLDRDNLAEEVESLGRSERNEIESRLVVLLAHLLKWKFQPEKRSGSWEGTILEQRTRISRRLTESPNLKDFPAEILAEEYEIARLNAAGETGLDRATFPQTCPFTLAQILDKSFLP
ncbi:MAG: DUF29 domain-containing protein [Methylobacterium mesophilicum]|nr:DUF29 domain-containing protein [Methylobacterium mesophilicum]